MLALLSGLLWAQSQEQYVDQVEAAIKKGLIAAIHDRLSVDVLASNPEWARRICGAAADCDFKHALREKDDLIAAARAIQDIGTRCADRNDGSADAWAAAADGRHFLLKVQRALGEETTAADWLELVDALAKLHSLEPAEGAPLVRAVKCLREGRRAKGVDGDELKTREDEVCRKAAELYPDNGFFAGNEQRKELEELVALLEAGEYKAAKPRFQELLGRIKDDTLYNDAVTVAKEHYRKLGIKADYRSREREVYGLFLGDFPTGERWKFEKDTFRQYGRDGKLIRSFSFDYFKRNTWYTLGDTKYDGSNVKGMALITERDVLSVIVKVARRSRIIKKRLNRHISGVQYFVIGGFDKDADFTRFHTYIWKGKERSWLTYRLWIIELADYEELDPEAQFVLDSLREQKYEEK